METRNDLHNVPLNQPVTKTCYWYGDLAEYTGNKKEMYGAMFYEIKLVEGHRKGQLKLTQREPK